ncbi:hypothetical protein U1Q18_031241 [Sarracenia purpurea var. burkii]
MIFGRFLVGGSHRPNSCRFHSFWGVVVGVGCVCLGFHPYSVAGIFGATSDQLHVSTTGIPVDSSCTKGFYEVMISVFMREGLCILLAEGSFCLCFCKLSFVLLPAFLPMRLATAVSIP